MMEKFSGTTQRREIFVKGCNEITQRIHLPLIDPNQYKGYLNPDGLGSADRFSRRSMFFEGSQSSVGFPSLEDYFKADNAGLSSYGGGAEYGAVRSPAAADVCHKMSQLHGGAGAVIVPSGLAAIATTMLAFAPKVIALPEVVYFPLRRFLDTQNKDITNSGGTPVRVVPYTPGCSKEEMKDLLDEESSHNTPVDMVYIEAPVSGTFEIPDIAGIVKLAKEQKILTVMDNTWASHVRFQPLRHGIDVAIQATTKYEGGFADTTSGVVIAASEEHHKKLARLTRVYGIGAVAAETCNRLYSRLNSTEARIDASHRNALELINWAAKQDFIADILSPAYEKSPYHERYQKYFGGRGNGLFTLGFPEDVSEQHVHALINKLNLFVVGESWGGHVSLVLPMHQEREGLPKGVKFRFHAGLEDANDLIRDLAEAAQGVGFNVTPVPVSRNYKAPARAILNA